MARTLNVGIIGVGGIYRSHLPGWEASPYSQVAAVADVNPQTARRAAAGIGIDRIYDSGEELIAQPDIDIIDICTPNMYHAPLAIAALEAGKHVICEKPLAPTPGEIRQMIKARDASGKLLMTAQHFRFSGTAQALKAEIDSGSLGEIYHARSWMLRRSGAPTREGFIQKKHSGGGPCIDIGVHILDLTLWMMGNPTPVSVTGVTQAKLAHQRGAFSNWGGPIPKTWDVEEFASAFVRFETGATLVLEVSWLLHHDTASEDMQMWLYGDRGGSHWPSNKILKTDSKTRQHYNSFLQNASKDEPHARECMAFAEAVARRKPSPVPAEQSLQVMGILDAVYRSAEAGREVAVEL